MMREAGIAAVIALAVLVAALLLRADPLDKLRKECAARGGAFSSSRSYAACVMRQ